MDKNKIENEYQKRESLYSNQVNKATKDANLISKLRLLAFFGSIGLAIVIYITKMQFLFFIIPGLLLLLFFILVIIHVKIENKKAFAIIKQKINRESLARLTNDWKNFPQDGSEWMSEEHAYAEDLDIFGPSSLYQSINTAESYSGRVKLKEALLYPQLDYQEIIKKQAAISELASRIDWRQSLQAYGRKYFKSLRDPKSLSDWSVANDKRIPGPAAVILRVLPFFSAGLLITNYTFNLALFWLPVVIAGLHTLLLVKYYKRLMPALNATDQLKDDLVAYAAMLNLFERESFTSLLLKEKQQVLRSMDGLNTSGQVRKLTRIIERSNIRYSTLYFIYNVITLWDIQISISLEKWKKAYGIHIRQWLETLAEVEVLASFSNLNCNRPDWSVPGLVNNEVCIRAHALGHPLLNEESKVVNDLDIKGKGIVQIITGSNMSGKSTWLRTIGINLVLAYNGTVTCAEFFSCSLFNIFSVMRVKDNLEKKISSFYAELLKIKYVIDNVRSGLPVFFLFDEIFKGTNSVDRHIGAKVLIRFLSRQGAVGLVSTHDLALGKIAEEDVKIVNFHFDESYENGIIQYHYKLLPGISKSRNAIYLMKMAGLQIDDDILEKTAGEEIFTS